jgi:hypothetical protein
MSMLESTDVLDALTAIATSLRSDGYDLAVSVDTAQVSVAITAGADACAECLVPKDLMRDMIGSELEFRGVAIGRRTLAVTYPADEPAHE